MAYLTYRVEITRDESRRSGTPSNEITAYIERGNRDAADLG